MHPQFIVLLCTITGTAGFDCIAHDPKKVPIRILEDLNFGRIEGCNKHGAWGSICIDPGNNFTKPDAEVACYQLGWAGSSLYNWWKRCITGQDCNRDEDDWINSVDCSGQEEYLAECTIIEGRCSKSHVNDINITCSSDLQAALEDISSKDFKGLLKYYFNQTWGYVCAQDWTDANANVICSQLGLGQMKRWYNDRNANIKDKTFLVANVSCNAQADERKLSSCSHTIWTTSPQCEAPMTPIWIECAVAIPDNLVIVTEDIHSVTLHWTVPEQLEYYPVIHGYSVLYSSEHSGTKTYHSQSISTSPIVTVPALDPGYSYIFKVAIALDKEFAQVGPYSKEISAETKEAPTQMFTVDGWLVSTAVIGFLLIVAIIILIICCCCINHLKKHKGYAPVSGQNFG